MWHTKVVILCLLIVQVLCIDLEVQVFYDGVPQPNSMYLRGDGLGLNWDTGVQLTASSTQYLWTGTFSYTSSDVGTM